MSKFIVLEHCCDNSCKAHIVQAHIDAQAEEIERLKALIPVTVKSHGWWCKGCKEEVDGKRITYLQTHLFCGGRVVWSDLTNGDKG